MSLIEAALRDQERRFSDLKSLDFHREKPGRSRQRGPLPPEKRSCKSCKTPLHDENKTGLCRQCGSAAWKQTYEASRLPCGWSESPCKTKIAPWSKSGLCVPHGNLLRTRIANRNRRAKARAEA